MSDVPDEKYNILIQNIKHCQSTVKLIVDLVLIFKHIVTCEKLCNNWWYMVYQIKNFIFIM